MTASLEKRRLDVWSVARDSMLKGNRRALLYVGLAGSFVTHLFLINWFFPFAEAFNDFPIINYDHPFHQERSIDRSQYILDGANIWGYNPRLMAGYVDGIVALNDGVSHWANFLTRGIFGRYLVYKVWVLMLLILPAIAVPCALLLFGYERICFVSSLLAVVLTNANLEIRDYYLYGLVPFVAANFVSLLTLASFWAYCKTKRLRNYLLVLVLLPLSFLFHPLSFFFVIVSLPAILFGVFRSLRAREWIQMVVLVSVTLLVNWHWITVLLGFRAFSVPEVSTFVLQGYPLRFIKDYFVSIQRLPEIWITIAGLCGLWGMFRGSVDRLLVMTLLFQFAFLSMLAYLGAWLGLGWLQPDRFKISGPIFLLPAAAYALRSGFQFAKLNLPQYHYALLIAVLMASPALGFHALKVYEGRVVDHESGQVNRLTTVMSDEVHWMIEWLKSHTDGKARIAVQEVGKEPPVGSSHFMPLLALRAGRELVGNYHYKGHSIFGVVSVDERFIGIPFEKLTHDKVRNLCERYNVEAVILHNASAKTALNRLYPLAQSVAQRGQLEIFRIGIKPSFFLVGSGELSADLNLIRLSNVTAGITVIKYHYFDLLKTRPPLPIERYQVDNDPVGFIKVINGNVREFDIYTDYHSYGQFRVASLGKY